MGHIFSSFTAKEYHQMVKGVAVDCIALNY